MKITKSSSYPKNNDTLIIPIASTANLEKQLIAIAHQFGIAKKMLLNDFKAEKEENFIVYPNKIANKIFLVGCGEKPNFKNIVEAFKTLSYKEKSKLSSKLTLDFSYIHVNLLQIEGAVNGLLLGTYNVGLYKSNNYTQHPLSDKKATLHILSSLDKKAVDEAAKKGIATATTQLSIMDLVNAPGNKATPETLAQWAIDSSKKHPFTVKVLNKNQIKKEQLDALLAVNKGSEYPPTFIIMEYKPKGIKNAPKVGLVGKGVTFDTGGLSIKPSGNMHFMKCDMGGAAAVLGAVELTAKLKLPIHLIGIVPATDNCVDASSIKPGDVISSYSGKTIEVTDTDAEGRLILADGVSYMIKNYGPETILDVATLTGSCVRTFGYHAGGLFTENVALANKLEETGLETGERLWRLPMWEDYADDIKSDVADVKNYSGKQMAGAITAAKFIEAFTEKHPCWAHLDIAGVAFGNSGLSSEKSATAFGVNLVVEFLKKMA